MHLLSIVEWYIRHWLGGIMASTEQQTDTPQATSGEAMAAETGASSPADTGAKAASKADTNMENTVEDSDDADEELEDGSKQQQGQKAPKESRHYQWAAEMKQRGEELERLGVSTAPKPISTGASPSPNNGMTQAESMSSYGGIPLSQAQGGSVWNTAGTWEDRDVSSWATSELKKRLKGLRFPVTLNEHGECVAFVRKVIRCSGSASVVYVRQKVGLATICVFRKLSDTFTLLLPSGSVNLDSNITSN
eukprot:gb/GECG01000518.1/.p1 GENE.gb/GECG01000518.1/~~gb/GECG01000518.1/.p1  ORF type:complete len:249 (+),score=35.47 gb/GECG01000518.1/:1-747(+)